MRHHLDDTYGEVNDIEGFLEWLLGVRSNGENYRDVLRYDPCAFCGRRERHMTVDHIEPVATGGRNGWMNLTAACYVCNQQKSARHLLSFLYNIRQHEVMYGI